MIIILTLALILYSEINVCVGKEWYRFPSNYFIPTDAAQLSFIKSQFTGQLPKPYLSTPDATSVIPPGFNDQNREEVDRYVRYLFFFH